MLEKEGIIAVLRAARRGTARPTDGPVAELFFASGLVRMGPHGAHGSALSVEGLYALKALSGSYT